MDGYQFITWAHESLCEPGREARLRLAQAADHFWHAMPAVETWPTPIRERAVWLAARLHRRGSLTQTIAQMSDAQVAETIERLQAFLEDFLRGDGDPT